MSISSIWKLDKGQHLLSQIVNRDSFNLVFVTPFDLYHPILKPTLADDDPYGHAQQVGVVKFHPSSLVTLVIENIQPSSDQFGVQAVGGRVYHLTSFA